jgi:hypothetical protein
MSIMDDEEIEKWWEAMNVKKEPQESTLWSYFGWGCVWLIAGLLITVVIRLVW